MPINDASVQLLIKANQFSSLDLGARTFGLNFPRGMSMPPGTGAGQVDLLFTDTRSVTGSGSPDDIDLAGGITDAFGAALTFVKVKGLFISAAAANVNNVIIGAAAANQFVGPFGAATHTITLFPGDIFAVTKAGSGWAVTAGTGDLLRINNSAASGTVNYDIVVLGTSA